MIKIAFYWHQHQPYYKDNLTGEYSMPWVRLHGIKDYIGMALLLEEFSEIRQTFNYVPCLLDQLKDYEENRAIDLFWKLTKIPAEDLTESAKFYILDNFFSANHQNMIEIYPRYRELLKKRNFRRKRPQDALKDFSTKDFQDLQVWANLTWYHPLIVQRDSLLSALFKKGEGFTEEDKEFVLSKQINVIRQIIPLHKRLQDLKQIEITTSPYYHPILPLLCNQESARIVLPKLSLPEKRFVAIEDAKIQVERAVQTYEKYFGQKPRGMWPSEGAVSDDIIPILAQAGFRWLASDEEILAYSLDSQIIRDDYGDVVTSDILYKPYRINIKGHDINIVFRDHNLSDLIGFQYSKYNVDTAVSDFINRINSLKKCNNNGRPLLVPIILDGENAWEHYPNSGLDFLRKLYEVISKDSDLECIRIGDYLEAYPPEQTLQHICPGSWIGHNLATWIGHDEKNTAWNFLEDTRSFIMNQREETKHLLADNTMSSAWEEIFIAEGSDWFWWFGDGHFTHYKDEFDSLFRLHLKNVYKLFNVDHPRILDAPIAARTDQRKPYTLPKRFLEVKLDGVVSNYFEWLDAGIYTASKDMDAMHRTSGQPIDGVYFGFNIDNLFIRVDFNRELFSQYIESGKFVITFVQPAEVQIYTTTLMEKPLRFRIKNKEHGYNGRDFYSIFFDKVIELSCSFTDLGFFPGIDAEFFIELMKDAEVIQRVPLRTVFCFSVPSKDFERMMWQV
ncbi:MAG: alpha-amylase/alpha-mannosidase [Planctomycetes bacterium]|nr:alpha-amylase/alpha-mannosidase [Planctomycetota bacterium]